MCVHKVTTLDSLRARSLLKETTTKVCQERQQYPKSTDYKIGACKSISWRASVEVLTAGSIKCVHAGCP